ncbi:MAG: serine hydrolase [Candidatus Andersenbacteria bacterium]|nr:serine hydrolase [Candidatus Andersenbacteria bacterium]
MHKVTAFFVVLCVSLSFGLGAIIAHIVHADPAPTPLLGTANIPLGLPIDASQQSTDSSGFQATSAIAYDGENNQILFQKNAFEQRPLASITKLMTAMIAIDHGIDWNKQADILPDEYTVGGELVLAPGETVTMKDLFNASLLGSANNATRAYVRQLGIPTDEFIQEMNRKAVELHLEQTQFYDVTGLTPKNVSSAYDIAVMAHYAFTHYPEISQATSQKEYTFTVRGTNREHTIRNTNKPAQLGQVAISGSKTGFLYEAGYCLVQEGANALKDRVAVVMNDPSEDAQFAEVAKLMSMRTK